MASLLRFFLHGSHRVRLTQQVDVALSEIRSDTLRPGKLDQIADVIKLNVVILPACSGRSINAISSLRMSLLYLKW